MVVRFIDGDEYAYVGVPGEVHRSFADADSKGRFFADEIRGRYPYNKLNSLPLEGRGRGWGAVAGKGRGAEMPSPQSGAQSRRETPPPTPPLKGKYALEGEGSAYRAELSPSSAARSGG